MKPLRVLVAAGLQSGGLLVLLTAAVLAQQEAAVIDGRPSIVVANDRLSLAVRSLGGTFAQLLLKETRTGGFAATPIVRLRP